MSPGSSRPEIVKVSRCEHSQFDLNNPPGDRLPKTRVVFLSRDSVRYASLGLLSQSTKSCSFRTYWPSRRSSTGAATFSSFRQPWSETRDTPVAKVKLGLLGSDELLHAPSM